MKSFVIGKHVILLKDPKPKYNAECLMPYIHFILPALLVLKHFWNHCKISNVFVVCEVE